jgi:hypothetical protein
MALEKPQKDAASLVEELVREKTPQREAVAVVQVEALSADGEAAMVAMAGMVLQEVPTTSALVGAASANRGGRSSPSLAQAGGDLPERGGVGREAGSPNPIVAILAFCDEMEDTGWRSISNTLSAALGALCDVASPTC